MKNKNKTIKKINKTNRRTNRRTTQRKTLKKKRKTKKKKDNKYFKKRKNNKYFKKRQGGRSGYGGKQQRSRGIHRSNPIFAFSRGDIVEYQGSQKWRCEFVKITRSGDAEVKREDGQTRRVSLELLSLVEKRTSERALTFDLSSDIMISGNSLEVLYEEYIQPQITHELCGAFDHRYLEDKVILEITLEAQLGHMGEDGRESCDNRNEKERDGGYKPYIFHTHPYKGKYYPSPEDIIKTVRGSGTLVLGLTHILFTKHGLWIMNSNNCPSSLDYLSEQLYNEIKRYTDSFYRNEETQLEAGTKGKGGRKYTVRETNRRGGPIETLCNGIMGIPILAEADFKIQWVEKDSEEWTNLIHEE